MLTHFSFVIPSVVHYGVLFLVDCEDLCIINWYKRITTVFGSLISKI